MQCVDVYETGNDGKQTLLVTVGNRGGRLVAIQGNAMAAKLLGALDEPLEELSEHLSGSRIRASKVYERPEGEAKTP
jgi:hypothetical protein